MIVYVESNFILEMVLRQREAGSVERILELAENGKIELAFPSFAVESRKVVPPRFQQSLTKSYPPLPSYLASVAR